MANISIFFDYLEINHIMKKIIEIFKKLFGIKTAVVEVKPVEVKAVKVTQSVLDFVSPTPTPAFTEPVITETPVFSAPAVTDGVERFNLEYKKAPEPKVEVIVKKVASEVILVAPKKVAPKKVAPKKVAPKKVAPKKVAPKKAVKKVAPKKVVKKAVKKAVKKKK